MLNGKEDSDTLPPKGYFRSLCFQRGCRFYSEPCSWLLRKHGVSEGRGVPKVTRVVRTQLRLELQHRELPGPGHPSSSSNSERSDHGAGLPSPGCKQQLWANSCGPTALRSGLDASHSHLPDESHPRSSAAPRGHHLAVGTLCGQQ